MAEQENNREKFIRAWSLHLAGWEQGSCWRASIVLGLWSSTKKKNPHPPQQQATDPETHNTTPTGNVKCVRDQSDTERLESGQIV